ncbi:hypothetical protein HORIV_03360 [Vreelandella olivaria]|uniref:Uncharacterized protein n=1 Tax=Vreelandella olivaria TaxID=390919 RepID=A0ABM7GC19_9GAMM|nr:hypothetical protein HORIV_03360 [Halomonas olivaria]
MIGQAGEYGQHLGVMQVTFDENGVVVDASGELLAADDREADADAAKRLEPYTAEIETLRDTLIGAKAISELPTPATAAAMNGACVPMKQRWAI